MNIQANEIIFIGKSLGHTAAGMLNWLTFPCKDLENKSPFDLLNNEEINGTAQFVKVLNALDKSYFERTGHHINHKLVEAE